MVILHKLYVLDTIYYYIFYVLSVINKVYPFYTYIFVYFILNADILSRI